MWKPWIRSMGCDVIEDRPPGEIYPIKRPGERYVECRHCSERTYSRHFIPPHGVDNPPDKCPQCGKE